MSPASSKAKPGNRRVTGKEQYYTPDALALQLTREVVKQIQLAHPSVNLAELTLIEPAGGTGAFLKASQTVGFSRVLSFDIEPKHAQVKKQNFLETSMAETDAVVISNPPFGRNNSLSIPFFNHAASNSEFIAFIVPRSWRKWSVINRLDRRFHLVHDQDIQIDYVDETGHPLHQKNNLNTCFQIWQRRGDLRPIYKVRDQGLVSKVSADQADVALTQFGFGCGTVATEFAPVANTTKLFLKLNHPDALAALKTIDYSRFYRHTAYTEALSLQEVNYLLNERILGNPHLEEIG